MYICYSAQRLLYNTNIIHYQQKRNNNDNDNDNDDDNNNDNDNDDENNNNNNSNSNNNDNNKTIQKSHSGYPILLAMHKIYILVSDKSIDDGILYIVIYIYKYIYIYITPCLNNHEPTLLPAVPYFAKLPASWAATIFLLANTLIPCILDTRNIIYSYKCCGHGFRIYCHLISPIAGLVYEQGISQWEKTLHLVNHLWRRTCSGIDRNRPRNPLVVMLVDTNPKLPYLYGTLE